MDYLDSNTLDAVAKAFYHPSLFLADPDILKRQNHKFRIGAEALNDSFNNGTDPDAEEEGLDPTLLTVYNVLVILQVSFLMLTVGTGVSFQGVKDVLKQPKGLILGLTCQLLLVPAVCFAVAHALQLDPPLAIGMVVVASCPGGAPSNLFTMLTGGDTALSVCMTAFSSILVLGTMPLNVFLYVRSWSEQRTTITPFINILIGVVFTWAPGLVGMLLRRRFPNKAQLLSRLGGLGALSVLVAFFLLNRVLFPGVFSLRWGVWYAALTMPLIAWLFAYGISMLFVVERTQRKAIAFGSSLVNGGLGVALISITYEGVNDLEDMLQFPMLYMALQIADAIIMTVLIKILHCAREDRTICQKWYMKRHRTSTLKEDEAVQDTTTANGHVNKGLDLNGDLPQKVVIDRQSSSGFYIPRNPSELAMAEKGLEIEMRERAFSV